MISKGITVKLLSVYIVRNKYRRTGVRCDAAGSLEHITQGARAMPDAERKAVPTTALSWRLPE